ncbi:MAG: hypothetical protein IIB23_03255 [Chloroflexi bacterium]|nr:hypothetical protein [Chloroflexota bacterium]
MRKLTILAGLAMALALALPGPASTAGVAVIVAGGSHTCALSTPGGLTCWGDNISGQLGDGTTTNSLTPVDVVGLTGGVAAATAGDFHSCALTTAGGLMCWGRNLNGQLGDATTTSRLTPTPVMGLASGVAAVETGSAHTCALTAAGAAKCWGINTYGRLGNGTSGNTSTTMTDVIGLGSGVEAIAAGNEQTCVITAEAGVKCWGRNNLGQLGNGGGGSPGDYSPVPVDVSGLSSGVVALAAGGFHTCSLTAAGTVACWGHNGSGQLGLGTTEGQATPMVVPALATGVAAIAAGNNHSCALTTAGGLKCWGRNASGQLGDGTKTDRLTPVDVWGLTSGVAAVATGDFHTCALMTAGGIRCWGRNLEGQLGAQTVELCPSLFLGDVPCSTIPLDVAGPAGIDTDGDGTPDAADADDDNDGCTDEQELGPSEALGGLRNPKNFWDFFDPNMDGSVSLQDVLEVLARFGAMGDPDIDPLSEPPPPPAYHTRFDRTGAGPGDNPWQSGPPDGVISLRDFLALLAQFGHTCAYL